MNAVLNSTYLLILSYWTWLVVEWYIMMMLLACMQHSKPQPTRSRGDHFGMLQQYHLVQRSKLTGYMGHMYIPIKS